MVWGRIPTSRVWTPRGRNGEANHIGEEDTERRKYAPPQVDANSRRGGDVRDGGYPRLPSLPEYGFRAVQS